MAVQAPALSPAIGHGRPRAIIITGTITIGAAGAVSSFSCEQCSSTGIVKTAAETGRYTVTFLKKYRNVRIVSLTLQGPADAAITSSDGWFLSGRNVSGQSFDIQASQVTLADANPTNGNIIHFAIEAQR